MRLSARSQSPERSIDSVAFASARRGADVRTPILDPTLMLPFALALLGLVIVRLVATLTTGFAGDEAYGIIISRTLALSYFDHPPLHQWIAHASALVFGETSAIRLPFLALALAINIPLFLLTRRLFGRPAAWWSVFAFNVTPYFVAWPDGLIIPDVPVILALVTAAWIFAEVLFVPQRSRTADTWLWLAAGAVMGIAGLAKYSAVFLTASVLGFLLTSQPHRHWLMRREPYFGGVLALAIVSPVIVWNMQHEWVSFAFQGGRAAPTEWFAAKNLMWFFQALGAQIGVVSPWVLIPLAFAVTGFVRARRVSEQTKFMLWCAGLPLAIFTVMPLFGRRTLPHWFDTGWVFVMPLVGAYVAAQVHEWSRRWLRASALLAGTAAVAVMVMTTFGLSPMLRADRDPTRWSYNWPALDATRTLLGFGHDGPAFALVGKWRSGGKAGLALGPATPVCALPSDPRGLAFTCNGAGMIGKDAVIVLTDEELAREGALIRRMFRSLDPIEYVYIGRTADSKSRVVLIHAHDLTYWPGGRYGVDITAADAAAPHSTPVLVRTEATRP